MIDAQPDQQLEVFFEYMASINDDPECQLQPTVQLARGDNLLGLLIYLDDGPPHDFMNSVVPTIASAWSADRWFVGLDSISANIERATVPEGMSFEDWQQEFTGGRSYQEMWNAGERELLTECIMVLDFSIDSTETDIWVIPYDRDAGMKHETAFCLVNSKSSVADGAKAQGVIVEMAESVLERGGSSPDLGLVLDMFDEKEGYYANLLMTAMVTGPLTGMKVAIALSYPPEDEDIVRKVQAGCTKAVESLFGQNILHSTLVDGETGEPR